jgi:hypothetical protein
MGHQLVSGFRLRLFPSLPGAPTLAKLILHKVENCEIQSEGAKAVPIANLCRATKLFFFSSTR